jgi:hypothetical protein
MLPAGSTVTRAVAPHFLPSGNCAQFSTLHEDPVVTGESTSNLIGMSFRQEGGRGHSGIIPHELRGGIKSGDRPNGKREEKVTGKETAGYVPWLEAMTDCTTAPQSVILVRTSDCEK